MEETYLSFGPLQDETNVTILVVDETPANLNVLLPTLEQAGFDVLVATDGRQALQRAALGSPDLILLDIVMPGIDGYETCEAQAGREALRDSGHLYDGAQRYQRKARRLLNTDD